MEEHDSQEVRDTRTGADGAPKPTMKLDPTTKHVLGRELGGYLIQGELGRGGMAMVYKAHDKALDRPVAVKVLPLHMAQDEEYAQRFEREAKAAARLDHPNVVQIYSAGRSEEVLYIAMQFVTGSPLNEVLHARRVGIREALDIVRQTALALEAAHKLGIVHRDVKPSNIMIDAEGKVKVMDFGLAKAGRTGTAITEAGTYLGTPEYSSPEQCETRDVDGRSDIYSLGVVCYEMLSGALPHVAETPLSLFKKITEERPIPVEELNRSVPKSVRQLLDRMLAKSKEKRFQTAGALVAAAERILKSEKLPEAPRAGVAAKELPVISGRIPVGRQRQSRKVAGLAVATLATAGAALCAMLLIKAQPTAPLDTTTHATVVPVDPTPTPVNPTPVATKDHVVVFDFKNLNPHDAKAEEYEWLEVGITEMLIANLSQHGGIEVMLRDDLVHEMSTVAHRKISVGDGADPKTAEAGEVRVNLNEETRKIVVKLDARWLLTGFFSVVNEKLTLVGNLHRLEDDKSLRPFGASIKIVDSVENAFGMVDRLSAQVLERIAPAQKTASAAGPATPAEGGWVAVQAGRALEGGDRRQNQQEYATAALAGNCRDAVLNRIVAQVAQNSALAGALDKAPAPGAPRGGARLRKDREAKELAKQQQGSAAAGKPAGAETAKGKGLADDPAVAVAVAGGGGSAGESGAPPAGAAGADTLRRAGEKLKAEAERKKSDAVADAKTKDTLADKLEKLDAVTEKEKQADGGAVAFGAPSVGSPAKGGEPGGTAVQVVVRAEKNEDDQEDADEPADASEESVGKAAHCLEELRVELGERLQKQIAVQVAENRAPGAGTADDRERRFKIWCVVQRRLEDLSADDACALQANTARLKDVILNQGTSLEDALEGIRKLFAQVLTQTENGKETGSKAPATTPAK